MLPINTILGQLTIFEIYEYLDGPRLFAARNNIGTMFLVFWFDEEEDATGWLYLPISEAKLNKLRRKEIALHEAFRKPETGYYLVYIGVPPRKDSAKLVNSDGIDADFFPPENYYIEYVDVVNEKTDGWSFETILHGKKPLAENLSQFIEPFRKLIEGIMKSLTGSTLHLYTQSVLPGSIKIRFSSDSNRDAIESFKIIEQLLRSNSDEEFRQQLKDRRINPSQLQDFLASVLSKKLDVEIVPKLASDGEAFKLPIERIQQCIRYLNNMNYIAVDSIKIPQANDIDKMLKVLRMMDEGIPLTPENIGGLTALRQVQYYTTAAYAYGLATLDEQLTAAGHFLVSHSDKVSQYQILADRFESTDFGWAWMKWAQVQSMTDLDPMTAADFLIASVPELSEVTAKRRASTLRKWLTELQPYHRKYKSE